MAFLWERTVQVWRRTSGGLRVVLLLVMALLLVFGWIVGLILFLLALLLGLAGMVSHSLARWRSRPVTRYTTEVEHEQLRLADQLHWLRREVALRDSEIERLNRELDDGRPADGA